MSYLPIERNYLAGNIAARFSKPLSKDSLLIIGVPGGPGLSGSYLDPFMRELGQRLACNVGMLDLPGHGKSRSSSFQSIHYPKCLEIVVEALREIQNECANLILFGQSFGARLAYDAVANGKVQTKVLILSGFPYKFQSSAAFYKKLEGLDLEDISTGNDVEAKFARNWKKILPLNLHQTISKADFDALSSGTIWTGNEQMLNETPEIEKTATNLPPALVLEGEFDPVVPDQNIKTLKTLLPSAHFEVLKAVGHFPMVEKQSETLNIISSFISGVISA